MSDRLTHRLLIAGIVAGPLVLLGDFAHAFLRPGFDLRRHASSQLALGDWGWVQALNFVVAGVLTLAFAIGARRAMRGSPGGLWGPLLLGVFAVSHVLVGLFHTDPAFGFPPGPGTPAGIPAYAGASTSAVIHSLAGGIGFNVLAAACFVFARHFGPRRAGWMWASLAVGAAILGIGVYAASWESQHTDEAVRAVASFNFLPMWALLPPVWGYLSALAWQLRAGPGQIALDN